ncbi:MAG TPA: hypothetical protein VGL66_03160 [Caulobacteraceae bacterium]
MSDTISVAQGPKVYAPLPIVQLASAIAGLAVMGAGLWGVWWFVVHPLINLTPATTLLFPATFVIAMILGACLALGAYRMRTLLYPDRFVSVGMFGEKELPKNDITGYRIYRPARGGPYMQLYTTGEHASVRAPMYRADAAYNDWFRGIPDLDEVDREDFQREVQSRADLGATPDERDATLTLMKQLANGLNFAGWGLLIWTWVMPKPYPLVIALSALAPIVAIGVVFWSRGVMTISQHPRHDPRPAVTGLFFAGFGLTIRAFFDFSVMDWMVTLPVAAVISLLVAGAAYRADTKALSTPVALFAFWAVSFAYGWGVTVEANTLFDHAPPQEFQSAVINKQISHSRRHTNYDLILSPWGPMPGEHSVDVGARLYGQVQIGDTVCIALHPGAFKVRWWKVRLCGTQEAL